MSFVEIQLCYFCCFSLSLPLSRYHYYGSKVKCFKATTLQGACKSMSGPYPCTYGYYGLGTHALIQIVLIHPNQTKTLQACILAEWTNLDHGFQKDMRHTRSHPFGLQKCSSFQP